MSDKSSEPQVNEGFLSLRELIGLLESAKSRINEDNPVRVNGRNVTDVARGKYVVHIITD